MLSIVGHVHEGHRSVHLFERKRKLSIVYEHALIEKPSNIG